MLTDKQEIFCREYVREGNATKAALLAGYSPDSAYQIGHENLKKVEIEDRIKAVRIEQANRFNITMERIIQEYSRIAFFDVRDVYDESGALKNIKDIDPDAAAAISGIESDDIFELDVEGVKRKIGESKKVKLSDKKGALDSLTRIFGFEAPRKSELTGKDGEDLFKNHSDSDLADMVAKMNERLKE